MGRRLSEPERGSTIVGTKVGQTFDTVEQKKYGYGDLVLQAKDTRSGILPWNDMVTFAHGEHPGTYALVELEIDKTTPIRTAHWKVDPDHEELELTLFAGDHVQVQTSLTESEARHMRRALTRFIGDNE